MTSPTSPSDAPSGWDSATVTAPPTETDTGPGTETSPTTTSPLERLTWMPLAELPDPDVYAVVLGPYVHTFQRMFSTHYQIMPSDPAAEWVQNLTPPSGLAYRAAGALEGGLYLVGGSIGSEPQRDALVRAETSWEKITPLARGRTGAVTESVAGRLHVIGGSTDLDIGDYLVEAFDPDAGKWFDRASVPDDVALSLTAADTSTAVLRDQLYLFTSRASSPVGVAFRYDAALDSWYALPDPPESLNRPGVAGMNGVVYVVGGDHGGVPTDQIITFDPYTATYSEPIGTLPVALVHPTVVAAKGCLIVLGGELDAERQVPSSAAWRACPAPVR